MTTQNTDTRNFRTEVILIESAIEKTHEGKTYLEVVDMAGKQWRVGKGKEDRLKNKWNQLKYGVAIRITVGLFNGREYVEDFETVNNLMEVEAAKKAQRKLREEKADSIEAREAARIIAEQQMNGVETPSDLIELKDKWLRHALRNYGEEKTE